jgi:murein DD-endopeptidase MepM/ murein hydrolase activator NlpD
MKQFLVLLSLLLIILAGCTSLQPAPELQTPISTATLASMIPIPSATSQPTPTNTLSSFPSPFPVTEVPLPLPSPTPGAMQLFFPIVIPAEGGKYRPPLYKAPWSLSPYDHFYFSAPIAAAYPGDPEIDYLYGGVFFGPDIIHTGVDIPAPRGTNVLAAGPGTVVWAGIGLYTGSPYMLNDPYGLAVAIRQDFGYQDQPLFSIYAHMDEIDVVVGQWVATGAVLGKVGSTGNTTGPHLHFEVRLGKNDFFDTRNPELWLVPPEGYGVLAGRVMADYGTTLKNYPVLLKNLQTEEKYTVYTYASDATIHSDSYYNENLVLGNLPSGIYELNVQYAGKNNPVDIQILPGQVTYFSFYGFKAYDFSLPATPSATIVLPISP